MNGLWGPLSISIRKQLLKMTLEELSKMTVPELLALAGGDLIKLVALRQIIQIMFDEAKEAEQKAHAKWLRTIDQKDICARHDACEEHAACMRQVNQLDNTLAKLRKTVTAIQDWKKGVINYNEHINADECKSLGGKKLTVIHDALVYEFRFTGGEVLTSIKLNYDGNTDTIIIPEEPIRFTACTAVWLLSKAIEEEKKKEF